MIKLHHAMKTGCLFAFYIICSSTVAIPALAQKDEEVLKNWFFLRKDDQALYRYITNQAFGYLNKRKQTVSKIQSLTDWKKRQLWIRNTLNSAVGPLPERSPLNAKTSRIIQKDGFRIEHIIFESQPGFFVTSTLFIPGQLETKAPAIVYCSGHSETGYRPDPYQKAILNLVKKGFIVFAFDPVGQGERLEYIDEKTGSSSVGMPTRQHDMPGVQAFITGSSQARYMIWDGIRAVDYLISRPEVDTGRIGMTGRSGGGTQTAFIGAIDQRILAAAPEGYITNFTRLLESLGPPDAEQNLASIIKREFDEPDFLAARAPKPTLVISTLNDFFSIQGARETFYEVSRIYKAYGQPGNFDMVEDVATHASTLKNREAMYAFFQHALSNPGNSAEEALPQLSDEEMRITRTGQLSTSQATESVFSLNAAYANQLLAQLNTSRKAALHLRDVVEKARQLSGYIPPVTTDQPVFAGVFRKHGMQVQKYFVKGEGEYVMPYLLFVPDKSNNKAVLYLDPKGKARLEDSVQANAFIRSLVDAGCHVLIPDLIGTGETGPGQWAGGDYFAHFHMEGLGYDMWYGAQLIGRSLVGIRASDVVKLAGVLRNMGMKEIAGIGRREFSPILLHAAAFDAGISRVVLKDPYASYHSLATNRYYNLDFIEGSVPAALTAYDLPDLAAAFAPRKLLMMNITDATGKWLSPGALDEEMGIATKTYADKAPGNLQINNGTDQGKLITQFFSDWLK